MRLKMTLGLLLLGSALVCLPSVVNAQWTAGTHFYFMGRGYTLVDPGGLVSPESGAEAARETAAAQYFADTFGDGSIVEPPFVEEDQAPFDAGLSILLGAGAIAGLKRARARKKLAASI
jgi:hypothetical protein